MGFGEKIVRQDGIYYRGRFKIRGRKFGIVRNLDGSVRKFPTRQGAKQAASDEEAAIRKGGWHDPADGLVTFGQWAGEWYAGLDLAVSTLANYRLHLETHLLPSFGDTPLALITAADIIAWEREETAAGYAAESIRTWRATLHAVLEDAVPKLIPDNPAARKRGKGRRSGRGTDRRGPEKVITTPLGVLLTAERMSVLTGRDDEFAMVVTGYFQALRLGETVGLEQEFVRPGTLRVEWQLHEVGGEFIRCPPKDGSRGDTDLPPFLRHLLGDHMRRVPPQRCPCHGKAYVFRGWGRPRGRRGAMTVRHVAAIAGVSPAVVSYVVNGSGRVAEATRERVLDVIARTGWEPNRAPDDPAWHWRRSSFEDLFRAAASGKLPARDGLPERLVPLLGDGTRVRGRNAQGRAELCWVPVAPGLTPHGMRHSARTWLEESRVPEVLAEERLRHEIPGVSGAYRHVTPAMRAELTAALEDAWNEALDARLAMSPGSPVAVLGTILDERARVTKTGDDSMIITRLSPDRTSRKLRAVPPQAAELGRGGRI